MIDLGPVVHRMNPTNVDDEFQARLARFHYRLRGVFQSLSQAHRGPLPNQMYLCVTDAIEADGEYDVSFWLTWHRRYMWAL